MNTPKTLPQKNKNRVKKAIEIRDILKRVDDLPRGTRVEDCVLLNGASEMADKG